MNAQVFAKGLEKCRLLTTFFGQNVENLDDYGYPKIQDLVKRESLWTCFSYPFRHKTRLHCVERKARGMENGLCSICNLCTSLLYLCLLLI